MKNLKDILKRIEKEKIKLYKVGLAPDVLTNGNNLFNIDSFMEFVRFQKINVVFGCELFDDASDYLITEEVIEEELGRYAAEEMKDIIKKDIERYNENIHRIDFKIPCSYILACLYEGKYFFTSLKIDRKIDETFLANPDEKLQEIVVNNETNIRSKREERKNTLNELKKELKDKIMSDEKFLLCTNKQLRFSYIRDLLSNGLDNHFEPLRKFWLADTIRGICQEPVDFIELIWKELNRH